MCILLMEHSRNLEDIVFEIVFDIIRIYDICSRVIFFLCVTRRKRVSNILNVQFLSVQLTGNTFSRFSTDLQLKDTLNISIFPDHITSLKTLLTLLQRVAHHYVVEVSKLLDTSVCI